MKFQGKYNARYTQKSDLQYIKKADLPRSSSPNIPKYTQQVTIPMCLHKVHWIMHEHDADINDPSCPHCHAKEKNWKLDIYTGRIYDYSQGKKYIGCLTSREMNQLWASKGFYNLVMRERKWYYECYHNQNPRRYPDLPPIPSFVSPQISNSTTAASSRWIRKAQILKLVHR